MTPSAAGPASTFRRPITPLEWWFLGYPEGLGPTFGVVVEGDGALDPDRLTGAVAVASEACPGVRLVRREREWVDGGAPPPLRVVDAAPGQDLLDLPELQDCVTGTDAPLCEVVLVRRTSGGPAAVAFRADHAVMDAHGLLLWARDVFRALRGESPAGAPDPIADRDVYTQIPGHAESSAPTADKAPILGSCEPTSQPRITVARRALQGRYPGMTARLAALLAEVVAEQSAEPREASFYVPVDLRYYRPEARSTANLSLGMPVEVSAGEEWADVHARLLQAVKDGVPAQSVVPDVALTAPLGAIESIVLETNRQTRANERFAVDAVLAHPGRIDLADLHAPGFTPRTAFVMERPLPGEPPVINVLELDWHTEITMSWWAGDVTRARLDALLDRIVARLATRPATLPTASLPADREPADVVNRFLGHVAETPDAPALDGGPDGVLTYRQVERRTAAVAAALRERGAGPETVVGVLGDRSVASTIAVWGVLRAGAAYLPIDARNPDARIAGLLTDSRASICLVQRPYDLRDCVPEGCASIVVDDLGEASGDDPAVPAPEIHDDQLAFLIYTSGSTGRPKGVEIPHGALRAWTDWAIRDLGLDAGTRLPMLASLGFDVAACALYLPLLAGGTAVLRPAEVSHAMLRELLLESGANTLMMTPSHLALINRLGLRPTGFRAVVLMGEPLSTAVAREAQRVFGPDCAIVNSYGPTETTVIMTLHPFDADTGADSGPDTAVAEAALVPLGLPTTGTSVFVLDEHGRFAADGDTGEIWIGGPQLARGYRDRPELTARSFVRLADGTRVYRSGDLARRIPGGPLEFVSRVDDQVKILGHRVEPAETAHVLRGHPAVAEAVVLARPSGDHKALAAYVVRAPGAEVTADELVAHAAAALPAYLVPAATVFVDAIPHTMNSKVDAHRLPDPFAHLPAPASSAAARDGLAAEVAEIWSEILGVDPERLDDDTHFQHLGGNSLDLLTMLAAVAGQVVGEPARAGFDAALSTLLRTPTLRSVTAAAHAARSAHGPDR